MQSSDKIIQLPADPVRSKVDKEFQKNYDEVSEQEGVTIDNFVWINSNNIHILSGTHQTRAETIVQSHLGTIKNGLADGWGDFPPLGIIKDPLLGYTLISGHHRLKSAVDLGISEVPCFVLKFGQRSDGLCAMEEYKQKENNHKPALAHDEDAALKYLDSLKRQGYFNEAFEVKDNIERDEKIRKLAHPRLAEYYSSYSKQKRGGVITRFLNGHRSELIKTWTASGINNWFVNNGHLSSPGTYNLDKNQFDTITQAHTICTYPIGQISEAMRKIWEELRSDGASEEKLTKRKECLVIRVGVYDNRPKNYEDLDANRKEVLEKAKRMNLDSDWTPFVYNEILFVYQSLLPPNKEPEQPIVYKWDATKKDFV